MAFSDLCHISNAFKTVENEDQSERIMEENAMVRDLITKILDETGPEGNSPTVQPQEKTLSGLPSTQYPKNDASNAFLPFNSYQDNVFNYPEQNNFNFNTQNGFANTNGYVNYPENDVNTLLGLDTVPDSTDTVTQEQLNLLRLAAQEIGGAQFTNNDNKFYNFFEPNQRNSLPEANVYQNFNRPNSLNLEMNYNNFDNFNNMQRFPNKFEPNRFEQAFSKEQNTDATELLAYLSQLNLSLDRRDDNHVQNNMEFKMPVDMNHYQNEDFQKMQDERNKLLYNRNFQQMPPNKNFNNENFYMNDLLKVNEMNQQNFDFSNQSPPNMMNFKPNNFQNQNEFMQRRDMNQMMPREGFPVNGMNEQRNNFDNVGRENLQQTALMRQNQELARQMSLLMRNRPPQNQLNVDVNFLHENAPFNLGLGALLGPSPPVPPPVIPSPMLDLPLLAPFYTMRNMRGAATSSSILHARLDACYEQWRQLERERKRTEARLALAYPGRAVSSSNSIPVPRLPPCPTRVDRLTVDMLREHTKVLTLMGKMETLRASVCVAQNKKPNKSDDPKITVLKRGQENVAHDKEKDKEQGLDPATFDPSSWKDQINCLAEIAPHSEVEAAMLAWRSAVGGVQAARRRELHPAHTYSRNADPILQLADAVKQLCVSARRARCAMWCDLTLTVALAPHNNPNMANNQSEKQSQSTTQSPRSTQDTAVNVNQSNASKQNNNDSKEEKPKPEASTSTTTKPTDNKQETSKPNQQQKTSEKPENHSQKQNNQRRTQNYKHKMNQGRNDFYKNRYDHRFMHNRHPYHYLATGPIN